MPTTLLCLASYYKGERFLQAAKATGAHVILVTKEKLADAPWPRDCIDELFLMPDLHVQPEITHAVTYLARHREIGQIVALDEYDTATAAALREHLRVPGMGETTMRHFRDKLAMRTRAEEHGLPVPPFIHMLNHSAVAAFMERVPGPWVLKPRAEASAMGIKKINAANELWPHLDALGDRQSFFLLEAFVPGDVYHIDSIVWDREVVFASAQQYVQPPMAVYQGGGVFASRTMPRPDAPDGADTQRLHDLNRQLLTAFGLVRGVAHTEFIKSRVDGQFYFLETAARVGGASIDRMIEAATGVNLWDQWARLEVAYLTGEAYTVTPSEDRHAGLIVCLSQQAHPDLSGYADPEVVWRMDKKHHAGLILAAEDHARVTTLLGDYAQRFGHDFLATQPPLEQAPE